MNDIFITVFILLANLVSIFLTYKSFDKNMEKNKKGINYVWKKKLRKHSKKKYY